MSSTYDPKHFCLHCDDGNGEHVIGRDLGVEPDQVVAEEEVEEGPRRLLGRRTTSGTLKGRVGTATHMPSGQTVAVKCYDLDSLSERDFYEYQSLIRDEVKLMRELASPNVLTVLSSFVAGQRVCLVTPLMRYGSARDLLDSRRFGCGLPEAAVGLILRDVLSALAYLHSKHVVHRSVRASHILLDAAASKGGQGPPVVAKLGGFRYACSLYDPWGQRIQDRHDYPLHLADTNLNWLSPEILQQNLRGYNEKSDLYSLGVAACEMANGLVPYSEMPRTLMFLEKLRGAGPKLLDSSTIWDEISRYEAHLVGVQAQHQDQGGGGPAAGAHQPGFSSDQRHQPGDSGVGASVGSCSNLVEQNERLRLQDWEARVEVYSQRTFSDNFHDLVADCGLLDAAERPGAKALQAHPFIRQLKRLAINGAANLDSLLMDSRIPDGRHDDVRVSARSNTSSDEAKAAQGSQESQEAASSGSLSTILDWDF